MSEIFKTKDAHSPLKMLLTTPMHPVTSTLSSHTITQTIMSHVPIDSYSALDGSDDGSNRLITYFNQFSSSGETEIDPVFMDHCYSRPWNWRPEKSFIRPTKTLFIPKLNSKQNPSLPQQVPVNDSDLIDVESVSPTPTPIYDVDKARIAMEECEKRASLARFNEITEDWEEMVSKVNWTTAQSRLFSSMVKILNADRMARLAYAGTWNEPILRRAVIDKSVQRIRYLMASIAWDLKLTQWIHNILLDHLSSSYLAAYLDILQTLKSKVPKFVESMMFGPTSTCRIGVTSNESLFPLLKRPWDPVGNSIMQDKPKRLPGNPVIIIVPSATSTSNNLSKRLHKWTSLLATLAHVVTVPTNMGPSCLRMNLTNCAEHLFNATRAKIQEVRNECPSRPIILAGFNTGSAVVCQVAEVDHVVAVICMGFPILTAEGRRGQMEDYILDLQYPVLFVIGQNSHKCSAEEMEDLRERMRVETGLVIVGSADDYLHISKSKRRAEGITQSIVDRCILDEIGDFVGSIILAPYPAVSRQQGYSNEHGKNRIRKNSNASSAESEPPSPQPYKSRPVGRPPGPSKKKLLNFQGIVNPTHNTNPFHSNITTTPPSPPMNTIDNDSNISHDPNPVLPPVFPKCDIFRPLSKTDVSIRNVASHNTGTTAQPFTTPASQSTDTFANKPTTATHGSTLSHFLQTGIRPTPTPPIPLISNTSSIRSSNTSSSTGMRILENIPVSTTMASKLLSSSGRSVTLINSSSGAGGNQGKNIGNVIILPDGTTKCIRSSANSNIIRTVGSGSTLLSTLNPRSTTQKSQIITSNVTKIIPPRKQITKPPAPKTEETLIPPSSLTTADIMDLPIIFADDSPLTDNSITELNINPTPNTVPVPLKKPANRVVLFNKQLSTTSTAPPQTFNLQPKGLKRPAVAPPPINRTPQSTKFRKLYVSKRSDDAIRPPSIIKPFTTSFTPKKFDMSSFENFDLESELKVNTIPKTINVALGNKLCNTSKKATLNSDGKITNVTLRVPASFTRPAITSTGTTPARLLNTESSSGNKNKPTEKSTSSDTFTLRYETD